MSRLPLTLLATVMALFLLAACIRAERPALGPPPSSTVPPTPELDPAVEALPERLPATVQVATPVRAGPTPSSSQPIGHGSPLFPLPFLPVPAGQPLLLATGQLDDSPQSDLLLVLGGYAAEAQAWLWTQPGHTPGTTQRVDLAAEGIAFPQVADFDEDGLSDLAFLTESALHLRVAGGRVPLASASTVPGEGRPTGLIGGDFDGDGHLDLVTSRDPGIQGHRLALLAGNGKGQFRLVDLGLTLPGGDPPLAMADVDGDGAADLLAVNNDDPSLLLAFGGREPLARRITLDLDEPMAALAAADLDRNGLADLVLLARRGFEAGQAQVWLSLAGADPGRFQRVQSLELPGGLEAVTVQDLNSDGWLDLVFSARPGGEGYHLFLQDPSRATGLALGWKETGLPVQPAAGLFAAGDLNGDGLQDLAALAEAGNSAQGVALLLATQAGDWLAPVRLIPPGDVWAIATADFDGDGQEDLAVARSPAAPDQPVIQENLSGTVELFRAEGMGYVLSARQAVGHLPLDLLATDLDGDGANDLVSADYGAGQLSLLRGDGAGRLAAAQQLPAGLNPHGLAAGDLNGDGRPDLLAANSASGEVKVYLGREDGSLVAGRDLFVGLNPWAMMLADYDGDKALDLVVAQAAFNADGQPGSVLFYPGRGSGDFGEPVEVARGPNPMALTSEDFDGDGLPDLAVAFANVMASADPAGVPAGDGVAVLLGDGASGLREAWRSSDVPHPQQLAAADFDGDGIPDLVVGGAGGGSPWHPFHALSLLPGQGDGTFGAAQVFGQGGPVRDLALLDANRDTRPDVLLAQPDQGSGLTLYTNSPTLARAVSGAEPESLQPQRYAVPGRAPNPEPGYPSAWQPLTVAGATQLSLPPGSKVQKLLVSPQAGLVYALDSAGTIHRLNSLSLTQEAAWPVNAQDMVLDEGGARLLVARRDLDETLVLEAETGRQLAIIPRAGSLALDGRRGRLFIVDAGVWLADVDSAQLQGALPASFRLFSGYIYSPGNLSAFFDPVADRLVVRSTLGGPGSSGSVQYADAYDGETLARLPMQFSRSYWLSDMEVDGLRGEFYATGANLDASVHELSIFDPQGQLAAELVGVGAKILTGGPGGLLYLVDGNRLATVDPVTHSVLDFTPLPQAPTAAASEPGDGRLFLAMPDGQLMVLVAGSRALAEAGPPQAQLPADRAVLGLQVSGDLLLARVAAGPEPYRTPQELYRSQDGGLSWQRIDPGLLGAHADQVVVQPSRGLASMVWVVGHHGARPAGILRGFDGGVSWQLADVGLRHLRVTDLKLAPGTRETLFALSRSDQRLYRSTDGGSSWAEVHPEASDFLLSPLFAQDDTLWVRSSSNAEAPYAISTEGGSSWQVQEESPWWSGYGEAGFFFSPGWPENGAAYRVERDSVAVKLAGSESWEPLALPRPRNPFEGVSLYFVDDEQALMFLGDSYDKNSLGALYWTADGGQSWRPLLDGQELAYRLTAAGVDDVQLRDGGWFWLGTSDGQVQRFRLSDLVAPPRTVRALPTPAPTPEPGLRVGDLPPEVLLAPDSRLASQWELLSAALGWATTPTQSLSLAEEPFERGLMIWLSQPVAGRPDLDRPTILVLEDGSSWTAVADSWQEGQPSFDPNMVPPEGYFQPVRGFGKVWREQPGMRDRLGWATGLEQGLSGLVQPFQRGLMVALNGRAYALLELGDGSRTWQVF